MIDDGHESAYSLILGLLLFLLRELVDSVGLRVFEVVEEPLHGEFKRVEGLGLDGIDEVLVGDELLVVWQAVVGQRALVQHAEPVVVLLPLLSRGSQLVTELLRRRVLTRFAQSMFVLQRVC